jgi:DNA-binding transcriptional LysR family regulator
MGLYDLELRHLMALEAVASAGTFAKAAEKLGYTQSAVSQQIASLERILGDRVFDRPGGPRPVTLTPLGERLLGHGRDLLRRMDATVEDLERFRAGDVGRLAIGTYQSVSATVLPKVATTLYEQRPGLKLRVEEIDDDLELHHLLVDGCIDLKFTTLTGADDGCEIVHLIEDPFVLLARPGQFPAGPVPASVLNELPSVGQPESLSCQLFNERGLRSLGADPNYVFRTADNGTVVAMVQAGMGVAVLPLLCVDRDDPRIALHRLEPDMPARQVALAWLRDRTLPKAAERFIEITVDVCNELAGELDAAMERLQPGSS